MPKTIKKTKNLTIRSREFVGIHKLVKYETKIEILNFKYEEITINDHAITHEIHFVGDSLPKSTFSLADPNIDIGLIIWFGAASAIDRESGSKCLIHNNDVYQIATWTDVLDHHTKQSDLRRMRDNRMIYYLMKTTNESFIERIMQAVASPNWCPVIR